MSPLSGWQVTLCDPMWHVSSRSSEAVCELLYTSFTLPPSARFSSSTYSRGTEMMHVTPLRRTLASVGVPASTQVVLYSGCGNDNSSFLEENLGISNTGFIS